MVKPSQGLLNTESTSAENTTEAAVEMRSLDIFKYVLPAGKSLLSLD